MGWLDLARRVGEWVAEPVERFIVRSARRVANRIVETDTLRIVLDAKRNGGAWWSEGKLGHEPAMQVVANWTVTNVSDRPIRIAAARLASPPVDGMAFPSHPTREQAGPYLLPQSIPVPVHTNFWIQPPTRRAGEDLTSRVIFVDNLGNEIISPPVQFAGPKPRKVAPPGESAP